MADRTSPGSTPSSHHDRPDPVARLDDTAAALAALHEAFTGEEPLEEALRRIAETAARAVPDADAVTASLVTEDRPRTAATTDSRLADVDERQYRAGRGPSLDSARLLRTVRAATGEHRDQWPEFEAAAEEHCVRAYLSVPVVLPATDGDPERHIGSLNIYSFTASAFDPFDEGLLRLFTASAQAAITSARRWQHSRAQVQQLERALTSRAVIDQAKGVLMAVHSCTADEAFTKLVQQSQRENVKLRDVATNLLSTVRRA
ncbi:GAF and ANTAR domain-containing protein [Lentzea sp. NBRC 102530]|uniref:GAF and ANTAR domain-containing protein n=1 Tax=Lentzea sp. NBRC 102530 TaxID=3032201 RepID=UPI0024A23A31|nr:GAF and ANTAR domain-containing protein [Lentzea sp. NBRC 102530]GLY47780.1 transcriptional regulator [Lentzea sp. NBRC 102530]